MSEKMSNRRGGFTLIEVTIAVAIFSIVIAASAQTMISLVLATRLQKDRVAATHSARIVLNAVREKRGAYRAADETALLDWTAFSGWITTQNTAHWTSYLTQMDGAAALANNSVTVELRDPASGATTTGSAAINPVEVHVIVSWTDIKGRTDIVRLVSRLSDR